MTCSGAGLVSIVVLGLAVVLNILSFSLPLWSTSNVVNASATSDVLKADFTAGVWGYCTDVELNQVDDKNQSTMFDNCYYYHTSNEFEGAKIDADWANKFSGKSICSGYAAALDLGDVARKVFTTALAINAGMDATQFDQFIARSCGPVGYISLYVGIFTFLLGALAFAAVVLGVTCFKNDSRFNVASKGLVSFVLSLNVLTFIFWLIQAHPLNKEDDVSVGGSFILSVLSAVLFLIADVLLRRHNNIRKDYLPIAGGRQ